MSPEDFLRRIATAPSFSKMISSSSRFRNLGKGGRRLLTRHTFPSWGVSLVAAVKWKDVHEIMIRKWIGTEFEPGCVRFMREFALLLRVSVDSLGVSAGSWEALFASARGVSHEQRRLPWL